MQKRCTRELRGVGLIAVAAAALALVTTGAQARRWVGDLVYCDANANGTFDAGESPLDGVGVNVRCTDDLGLVCADYQTETGTLHESTDGNLDAFNTTCGEEAGWDPTDPSTASGRYLVEVLAGCMANARPFTCEVRVDEATLPADCNEPVTPLAAGFPVDGNGDGDACDAEDGPFPEGQPLGNIPSQGGCEAFPDPLPADGVYTVIVGEPDASDRCSLYNDFGYTGEDGGECLGTRTPGFYKNHPDVVAELLPIEFCGAEVTDVCEAIRLLRRKGGGFKAFTRHAVAASLSCQAFGCTAEVAELLAAGNAACAAGDDFEYGAAASILDTYNNSCKEVEFPFDHGSADPKFCKRNKTEDHPRHRHHAWCHQ